MQTMPKQNAKGPAGPAAKSSANFGVEAKLWLTADKLRNNGGGRTWSPICPMTLSAG